MYYPAAYVDPPELTILTEEMNQRLRKDAIVSSDEKGLMLCLDMAMQRYAAVARK